MCELIGRAIDQAIERRRLLGGTGASIIAASLGNPASAAEVAQQQARIAQAKSAAAPFNTRLLLLGTAGGPVYWTNTNRRSISSALVVGDAVYLVDCGDGVGKRLQEALDPPSERVTMKTLRAVFLTHLHSDHVVDYPNILLYGWYAGIEAAASPLRVLGPGRRGEMEPTLTPPGRQAVEPPVMNPGNPTPETEAFVSAATKADSLPGRAPWPRRVLPGSTPSAA